LNQIRKKYKPSMRERKITFNVRGSRPLFDFSKGVTGGSSITD